MFSFIVTKHISFVNKINIKKQFCLKRLSICTTQNIVYQLFILHFPHYILYLTVNIIFLQKIFFYIHTDKSILYFNYIHGIKFHITSLQSIF